jgi:hexosaminidase
MTDFPLIPAPRSFLPSGQTVAAATLTLKEALVPRLGFVPAFVPDEAYELNFGPEGAHLSALTPAGLAHGRTTWKALQAAAPVPAGRIQDEPRFAWRGLMLDVSRHFYPVAEVKAVIDRLATLKLNRFHWHLIDDQGWRLEIPGYPKFTEVGAWRVGKDGTRYGGYYTEADVREVLDYAAARSVMVVPEVELPGHSLAGLASYPELACSGKPAQVETKWGIFDGVYCASSEAAATILEAVLAHVCRLFPSPFVHIGGDEVVRTRWESCPNCQAKIRSEGLNGVEGLESAFFRRFIAFVEARGKTAIGWNELFEHTIPKTVPVQWWHRPDLAVKTLKTGNPLLVSDVEYCYFDYPYTAQDPWYLSAFMKITPVEKVYANPVIPPGCDAWVDRIWGGEACLWTEQVPPDQAVNRLRGRLEAFAEVYWTFDRRPGWDSFKTRGTTLGLL